MLLRRDTLQRYRSKEKSILSNISLLIQRTPRKYINHFLTQTISHLYHPNQLQTNKITR